MIKRKGNGRREPHETHMNCVGVVGLQDLHHEEPCQVPFHGPHSKQRGDTDQDGLHSGVRGPPCPRLQLLKQHTLAVRPAVAVERYMWKWEDTRNNGGHSDPLEQSKKEGTPRGTNGMG